MIDHSYLFVWRSPNNTPLDNKMLLWDTNTRLLSSSLLKIGDLVPALPSRIRSLGKMGLCQHLALPCLLPPSSTVGCLGVPGLIKPTDLQVLIGTLFKCFLGLPLDPLRLFSTLDNTLVQQLSCFAILWSSIRHTCSVGSCLGPLSPLWCTWHAWKLRCLWCGGLPSKGTSVESLHPVQMFANIGPKRAFNFA